MTRLTHREAAEAVLAGKGLTWQDGEPAKNGAIDMRISMLDRLSDYYLADPTPQPTEAPMPFDPKQNRVRTDLLTPDESTALKAAKHGWLVRTYDCKWVDAVPEPSWYSEETYRAKPAPAPTLSITVNGVTNVVAAGVTEKLEDETRYFMPCPGWASMVIETYWTGDEHDFRRLRAGLIHLTEAADRAHAMAMVGPKAEGLL